MRKTCQAIILVILILFISTQTHAQLRIMPLGDSITQGKLFLATEKVPPIAYASNRTNGYDERAIEAFLSPGNGGYRFVLEQILINLEWDVEMVGQRTEGGGNHEGYPGLMTSEMIPILPDILQANPPDVILLHIGTNDLPDPISPDSSFKNIKTILDIIHNFDSDIKVILAQIIPCLQDIPYGKARYPAIIEFNNLLPLLLSGRPYLNLVDMWTPFVSQSNCETELISETWHLNDASYYMMAQLWRDSLTGLIEGRSPVVNLISPAEAHISENNFLCTIEGDYFFDGVSVYLQRETGQQLEAISTSFENQNQLHANFNLTNGIEGEWQVFAKNPNHMRSVFSTPVYFTILPDLSSSYVKRINAGGDSYTDQNGNLWLADLQYSIGGFGYVGGNVYSTSDPISRTEEDVLYQSERWGMDAYQFDVPDGDYEVTLHFAEIYLKRNNRRLMSVAIEGQTVLTDLDIHRQVGHDAALEYTFNNILVTDGRLDIAFSSTREQAKISAIEISSHISEPILSVNPNSLDFGLLKTSLNLTITNSGAGQLTWDVSETPEQEWISSIYPKNGALSGGSNVTVTVTVDRTGQTAGTYNGTLHVSSNGGSADVCMTMTVPGPPLLSVSPKTLDFGIGSVSLTFEVSNSGGGSLNWNASENPETSWIVGINPSSGSLSSEEKEVVTVIVDRSGLSDGEYNSAIDVISDGGNETVLVLLQVAPVSNYIVRLNAGGGDYTDVQGNDWSADREYAVGSYGYVGGNVYSTSDPISRTEDDVLYQSERWGMDAYQFDVPDGKYEITLHFAEIYLTRNNRRFMSVAIEGQTVLTNLDIHRQVGHDAALEYTFSNITITDGRVDITFTSSREQPKISAIEVKSIQSAMLAQIANKERDAVHNKIPVTFALAQNYPNPFNSSTKIRYELAQQCFVSLKIFNVLGKYITTLTENFEQPGIYEASWNGQSENGVWVTSGVYFCYIKIIPDDSEQQPFVLIKRMVYEK